MDITQIGTSLAIIVICYLIGMYVMPEFPASDIMTAIAVGIVSGLASTGVNQVYKQVKKDA